MGRYIFGARNKIHIIDLSKTVPMLHQAFADRKFGARVHTENFFRV